MRKMWTPRKTAAGEGGRDPLPDWGDKIYRIARSAEKVCPALTRHFFGHITVSKDCPVVARCMAPVIEIRADVLDLPLREQVFILLHELEHLHKGHHVAMMHWFGKRPVECDPRTWEALLAVGADLEVNAAVTRHVGYRSLHAAMPGRAEFKRLPAKGDAYQYALAMVKDDEATAKSLSYYRNIAARPRTSSPFPKSRRHMDRMGRGRCFPGAQIQIHVDGNRTKPSNGQMKADR